MSEATLGFLLGLYISILSLKHLASYFKSRRNSFDSNLGPSSNGKNNIPDALRFTRLFR